MKKMSRCNPNEQFKNKMKLYRLNSTTQSNKCMLKGDIQMILQMLFLRILIKYWVFILLPMNAILSLKLIKYNLKSLEQINLQANQINFTFMEVWMQELQIDKLKVTLNNLKSVLIMILIKYLSAPTFLRIKLRRTQLMYLKHC